MNNIFIIINISFIIFQRQINIKNYNYPNEIEIHKKFKHFNNIIIENLINIDFNRIMDGLRNKLWVEKKLTCINFKVFMKSFKKCNRFKQILDKLDLKLNDYKKDYSDINDTFLDKLNIKNKKLEKLKSWKEEITKKFINNKINSSDYKENIKNYEEENKLAIISLQKYKLKNSLLKAKTNKLKFDSDFKNKAYKYIINKIIKNLRTNKKYKRGIKNIDILSKKFYFEFKRLFNRFKKEYHSNYLVQIKDLLKQFDSCYFIISNQRFCIVDKDYKYDNIYSKKLYFVYNGYKFEFRVFLDSINNNKFGLIRTIEIDQLIKFLVIFNKEQNEFNFFNSKEEFENKKLNLIEFNTNNNYNIDFINNKYENIENIKKILNFQNERLNVDWNENDRNEIVKVKFNLTNNEYFN